MTRTSETIYEEMLVLKCQDGEEPAFNELFARWNPRLLRHALRLTGRPEAARDAIQESWIAIVRGIKKLRDPAMFQSWAYRIVGNKCADWVRKASRRRSLHDELVQEAKQVTDEKDESTNGEIDRLLEALKEMSAEDRALLALFYQESLGIAEIARCLGIPPGTVKSRLHHARNRLKESMERIKS